VAQPGRRSIWRSAKRISFMFGPSLVASTASVVPERGHRHEVRRAAHRRDARADGDDDEQECTPGERQDVGAAGSNVDAGLGGVGRDPGCSGA